ncbi:MAG: hypothetical protein ACKOU7_13455 [Ferruginibacter sp.]
MNPSFNIQAPEIDFETAQLFAEAGPTGISLAVQATTAVLKLWLPMLLLPG